MTAQELKLDYFKIYDVENRPVEGKVSLRGQFDRRPLPMQLRLLDFFANPVAKNGEPMFDKNAHLAWYRGAQPQEPKRRVTLANQFGKFELTTGTGWGLLVPTQKVEKGSVFPEELDHFKVYRLADVGKPPEAKLKLEDQFGSDEVKLGLPLFFAVPVIKRHGTKVFPIHNERAHLLIFLITTKEAQKKIKIRNQFTKGPALAVRSVALAVPSLKLEWKLI